MVDGTHLIISHVKKADTQMLQCKASNIHGYLLADAYLNIQGIQKHMVCFLSNSRNIF